MLPANRSQWLSTTVQEMMVAQELVSRYNAGEREFSSAYLVRANLSGVALWANTQGREPMTPPLFLMLAVASLVGVC